jgi:glucose-1-phosphate cytidylyltransferase
MKTVILCGGLGTRLAEETDNIPKPMVKIGDKPIVSHIINYYLKHGFKDFIICSGYKKNKIKEYFKNNNNIKVIDTGLQTQTGARIKKIKKFLNGDDNFFMTYGDGLSNVNLKLLLEFHKKHNKIGTLTAVRPLPRFGNITLKKNKIVEFKEKDALSEGWINGGFFVLNKKIFKYINDDEDCIFERQPLQNLSKDSELMAFKHEGFWHPMDTLRDKKILNDLLQKRKAPWII